MLQNIVDWFMTIPNLIKDVREVNKKTGGVTKWNVLAALGCVIAGAILLYLHRYGPGIGCLFVSGFALFMNGEIAATILRHIIVGSLTYIACLPLSFLGSLMGLGEFSVTPNTVNVICTGIAFGAIYFLRPSWLES